MIPDEVFKTIFPGTDFFPLLFFMIPDCNSNWARHVISLDLIFYAAVAEFNVSLFLKLNFRICCR